MKHAVRVALIAILSVQMIPLLADRTSAQSNRILSADPQVGQLLLRINTRKNAFNQSLIFALNQGRIGSQEARDAREHHRDFDQSFQEFRRLYNERRATESDLMEVLDRAAVMDRFMRDNQVGTRPEQDWEFLRSDIDQLARRYNVFWDRSGNQGPFPNEYSSFLTGTYRLDSTRSDDATRVANQVTRGLPVAQRDRITRIIMRRLQSPEMIAIDRRGEAVTIASTLARPATLEADGRVHTEQTPRGRTVRVSADLVGDQLIVSSSGDRGNDYRVTFEPANGGRTLRVTRQVDIEGLGRSILVNSVYNRISNVAQLDLRREPSRVGGTRSNLMVPNGTQLIATLNNSLSTERSREGDRVTLTVQSPLSYRGAVIEGYISEVDRSGRLTGHPELAFNFERIRLRNGVTYDFDGYIESIRTLTGDNIRVNNEGVLAERDGQTERTVTRTGIGAAIGALIGAIAGGGRGAAIGAALGAGAGAGSVFVEGRDDLDLPSGTEFMIRASSSRSRQDSGL